MSCCNELCSLRASSYACVPEGAYLGFIVELAETERLVSSDCQLLRLVAILLKYLRRY